MTSEDEYIVILYRHIDFRFERSLARKFKVCFGTKHGLFPYPTTNHIYALYDVITTGHPEHPEGARDT